MNQFVDRIKGELTKLWNDGLPSGDKTGWASVDELFTVYPGQLTVVTGWPGSGKSEFIDALVLHLAMRGWKWAIFSFENQPVQFHIVKILEKITAQPFGAGKSVRIEGGQLNGLVDRIFDNFYFYESTNDPAHVGEILEKADAYFETCSGEFKRGIVIDPWNEVESTRDSHLSETEYISKTLSKIRNWARLSNTHVFLIAHPAKQKREEGGTLPIAKPDMISGSMHWWNKADNCLTIFRDPDLKSSEVDIHCQKIRFKYVGKTGYCTLRYDRITGQYFDDVAEF